MKELITYHFRVDKRVLVELDSPANGSHRAAPSLPSGPLRLPGTCHLPDLMCRTAVQRLGYQAVNFFLCRGDQHDRSNGILEPYSFSILHGLLAHLDQSGKCILIGV